MKATFYRLNDGWNAEPNAPSPTIQIQGEDIVLRFYVNPFMFPDFAQEEIGILRFVRCQQYRLGAINDEGWHLGQCRFSKMAPAWGQFNQVCGDFALLDAPKDWRLVCGHISPAKHFLFHFRDITHLD